MSDINKIYSIDDSFKQEKSKLMAEHEKEISTLTDKYIKNKKKILEKISKLQKYSMNESNSDDVSKKDLKKSLNSKFEKLAKNNATKLEKKILDLI